MAPSSLFLSQSSSQSHSYSYLRSLSSRSNLSLLLLLLISFVLLLSPSIHVVASESTSLDDDSSSLLANTDSSSSDSSIDGDAGLLESTTSSTTTSTSTANIQSKSTAEVGAEVEAEAEAELEGEAAAETETETETQSESESEADSEAEAEIDGGGAKSTDDSTVHKSMMEADSQASTETSTSSSSSSSSSSTEPSDSDPSLQYFSAPPPDSGVQYRPHYLYPASEQGEQLQVERNDDDDTTKQTRVVNKRSSSSPSSSSSSMDRGAGARHEFTEAARAARGEQIPTTIEEERIQAKQWKSKAKTKTKAKAKTEVDSEVDVEDSSADSDTVIASSLKPKQLKFKPQMIDAEIRDSDSNNAAEVIIDSTTTTPSRNFQQNTNNQENARRRAAVIVDSLTDNVDSASASLSDSEPPLAPLDDYSQSRLNRPVIQPVAPAPAADDWTPPSYTPSAPSPPSSPWSPPSTSPIIRQNGSFRCASPNNHPVQAPISIHSRSRLKPYQCPISPFISYQAWATCQQQHQTCYHTCLSNQQKCDDEFQHCLTSACGTGILTAHSCQDVSVEDTQSYHTCATRIAPVANSFFQTSKFNKAQSQACMCVPIGSFSPSSLDQARRGWVLPPSALESWPFYTIDTYSQDPTQTTEQSLYEQLDVHDFIPPARRLGVDIISSVSIRHDVLAMSSASQVLGVDYASQSASSSYAGDHARVEAELQQSLSHHEVSSAGSLVGVKAGLVLAKGKKILEHYIPTCARLAGGRVLGVFVAHVGGDEMAPADSERSPPHKLYVGVTEQGQGRGIVMTTSLIIQVFADHMEVSNVWAPSLAQTHPNALGVLTVQIWASVWEKELFFSLVSAELEHLSAALIPVKYHTHAKLSAPYQPSLPQAEEESFKVAATALGVEHATRSAGAWIESLSFSFPASVRLVLRSSNPSIQRLQLEIHCWSEANAVKNSTFFLPVDSSSFHPATDDQFLGNHLYTQVLIVPLPNTIDSVFILRDTAAPEQEQGYADQAFTNLGYFFFFSSGLSPAASARWLAGHSDQQGHLPRLIPVADVHHQSHIILPGSGTLSVRRELRPAHQLDEPEALAAVSRSLTPLSTPVDISPYWGMSVLIRILPKGIMNSTEQMLTSAMGIAHSDISQPIRFQLQIESTTVTDYQFHRSSIMQLSRVGCWAHIQLPFTAFKSKIIDRVLDLKHASKLSLLVRATAEMGRGGVEGEDEVDIEIASFTLQKSALTRTVRLLHAPCSMPIDATVEDVIVQPKIPIQIQTATHLNPTTATATSPTATTIVDSVVSEAASHAFSALEQTAVHAADKAKASSHSSASSKHDAIAAIINAEKEAAVHRVWDQWLDRSPDAESAASTISHSLLASIFTVLFTLIAAWAY